MMDFLGIYSAQIISICALFLTMWGFYVQRKHNVISVQPAIATSTNRFIRDGVGYFDVVMENNGLGPAFIDDFKIYCDGKISDYDEAIIKVTKGIKCEYQKTNLFGGYIFKAGESFSLFSLNFPCDSEKNLLDMEQNLNRLNVCIHYACAYKSKQIFDTFEKKL